MNPYTLEKPNMATTAKKKPAAAAGSTAALRVVSKSPLGELRRAGLVFGPTATVIALADLTEDQADAIRAEPLLDVTDTVIESEAAKA